jgi:hypothetical protein
MPTPKCVRGCKDDEFWGDSKHYAANVYTVGPDVEEIQKELYTNGPVEVAFTVYQVSRSGSRKRKSQTRNSISLELLKCESKYKFGLDVEGIEKEPFVNGFVEVAFTVY